MWTESMQAAHHKTSSTDSMEGAIQVVDAVFQFAPRPSCSEDALHDVQRHECQCLHALCCASTIELQGQHGRQEPCSMQQPLTMVSRQVWFA